MGETIAPPRRRFLGHMAGAAASTAILYRGTGTKMPSLDAELLALGERLTKTWAAEKAAWAATPLTAPEDSPAFIKADALNDAVGDIVRLIEGVRALTVDGLLVKLQAINWCRSERPLGLELFGDPLSPTTDIRLAASIFGDLAAIGSMGEAANV